MVTEVVLVDSGRALSSGRDGRSRTLSRQLHDRVDLAVVAPSFAAYARLAPGHNCKIDAIIAPYWTGVDLHMAISGSATRARGNAVAGPASSVS
jgi:hypothetical protein